MENKTNYTIEIGILENEYVNNVATGKRVFSGKTDRLTPITFDTVEKAHDAVKYFGFSTYEIWEHTYDPYCDKIIFETSDVTEWKNALELSRKEAVKRKYAAVEKINALPSLFIVGVYNDVAFYVVRADASYTPQRSLKGVTAPIYLMYKTSSGEEHSLWVHNYVTDDKKVQKKKFAKEMGSQWMVNKGFGPKWIKEVDTDELLVKIVNTYNDIENQIKALIRESY